TMWDIVRSIAICCMRTSQNTTFIRDEVEHSRRELGRSRRAYTGCMQSNTKEVKSARQSLGLERRAEGFFPGGVNSPVRAFRAVGGHPPFVARAEGAYLYDADGNRYAELFGLWGPMIVGHAFPPVVEAIREAAGRGASFGASHAGEAELAELVRRCFPAVEKMRFVSSGTEACMSAIRLARGFTGRNFVVKFEGCYHG